jgi:hypothetical protein
VRTGAAIFALVAGLAVLGLMAWTLVGMIRSASRRARAPAQEPPDDIESESRNGNGTGSGDDS